MLKLVFIEHMLLYIQVLIFRAKYDIKYINENLKIENNYRILFKKDAKILL